MPVKNYTWILIVVITFFLALPTAIADDDESDADEQASASEEDSASSSPAASSTTSGDIQLLEAKTAADVEDREAVNVGDSFNTGDSVTVWMAFRNPNQAQDVDVVWKAGDAEVHTFSLNIGESWRWRTWAKLTVARSGDWTVEIRDGDGNTLDTVSFSVADGS